MLKSVNPLNSLFKRSHRLKSCSLILFGAIWLNGLSPANADDDDCCSCSDGGASGSASGSASASSRFSSHSSSIKLGPTMPSFLMDLLAGTQDAAEDASANKSVINFFKFKLNLKINFFKNIFLSFLL